MHDYIPYKDAMESLTESQVKALHEEGKRLREYALVYWVTKKVPLRTRYVMHKRSERVNYISRRNFLNFLFENSYLIKEELMVGRGAEVCYPANMGLTHEQMMQGLHDLEMEYLENGSFPPHLKMDKIPVKRGRPLGSLNKRKKVPHARD